MRARYVGADQPTQSLVGLEGEATYSPHYDEVGHIERGAVYFIPDENPDPDQPESPMYYVSEEELEFIDDHN